MALEWLGRNLDDRRRFRAGESLRERIIERWLKVRDKSGRIVRLSPNRMQREFERLCGARNILLKARQLGATTWIAARCFVHTITRRGTLTLLVAHDQEAAEEIFTIVRRFWANLPEALRVGALRTGRANVRQLTFPILESQFRVGTAADPDAGRGLTLQLLHASEVARWPRDARATLASLRAAVAPGGEVTLESTAQGAAGCFFEEWQRAPETGYVRHFYPWWFEPAYVDRVRAVPVMDWSDEERALAEREGLSSAQIGFRRGMRAQFRGLAPQVIDRKRGMQCAELRGRYRPEELSCQVAALGHEYHDALVVVERNGVGLATCRFLEIAEKYPQLHRENGEAGFSMNANNRIHMQVLLSELLGGSPEVFASPRLLREMRLFVRHRNGESGAASGAHDDTVMAFGIAQYIRETTAGKP